MTGASTTQPSISVAPAMRYTLASRSSPVSPSTSILSLLRVAVPAPHLTRDPRSTVLLVLEPAIVTDLVISKVRRRRSLLDSPLPFDYDRRVFIK